MVQKFKAISIEQLTEVALLRDLQATDLIALQPYTRIHFYQKGDVVMTEGDLLSPQLYTLIQGTLRLTRIGTSGKETLLRTLLPNEIFAAPALFGDAIAPATVTATIESQVLTIERSALLQQIRQTPELAFRILEIYNQRLQQMHQTIHDLVSESAIVRLANLLQRQANESGTVRIAQGDRLNLKLSHYQIARSIGISYEECVRLLSQIKAVVSYQRGGEIVVLDRETLDAIAAGTIDLKTLALEREARH
jgi:CRP/FNR family transcriptional regulator, cyclic AMP receptor protein